MNRIYQGRVTGLEYSDPDTEDTLHQSIEDLSRESESLLWHHHRIFQAATNYYLVALAALGRNAGPEDRLIHDLNSRIRDSWEKFPRPVSGPPALSLRDSLRPWLGLQADATIDEVYDIILEENEVPGSTHNLSLKLLLSKCGGEGQIQQGGRGYFPRLCDSKCEANYDFSTTVIAAEKGKERLSEILHSDFSQADLEEIATQMNLGWAGVKLDPGKHFTIDESRDRLKEAAEFIKEKINHADDRLMIALDSFENPAVLIDDIISQIDSLEFENPIPRNRKASKDLTFAALLFQHFPSPFTASILQLSIKKNFAFSDPENFSSLGDDPILLSRGKQGYVFRAFTALPLWNPDSPGLPVWKEFDIAAFKQALTGLNQFNQKTEERIEARLQLRGELAHLLGAPLPGWKPQKTEEGEIGDLPEPFEPARFALARTLEIELTTELNQDEVSDVPTIIELGDGAKYEFRSGEWKISTASLRKFRDIAEQWEDHIRKHPNQSEVEWEKAFSDIVKFSQQEEKYKNKIGSIPLFLRLCEKRYWSLWWDSDNDGEDSSRSDFLYRMARFHQTVRDWLRAAERVNLTPAEPRYSRRLYMFSDVKDKLAKVSFSSTSETHPSLECGIAKWNDNQTAVSEVRIKLNFSAPRLHRDSLLGGEFSRWLQPMMKALKLDLPEPDDRQPFESAVSLMPDTTAQGELRMLLNFPVKLDESVIHNSLGIASHWKQGKNFNGTRKKHLHLNWTDDADWYRNPTFLKEGFRILSVDLGQRSAGAWGILHITSWQPNTKKPVRRIGNIKGKDWYAALESRGMLRLSGEEKRIFDKRLGKGIQIEKWGKAGRNSSSQEWTEAKQIATRLLADAPENWVGACASEKSFAEQNDALLTLASQRMTRLNTFHRWSCFDPIRKTISSERREKMLEALEGELSHWQDPDVKILNELLAGRDFEAFQNKAGVLFEQWRSEMGELLVILANRTAPLRKRNWIWDEGKKSDGCHGELTDAGAQETIPRIRGQRGLSLARIEQLENLRRLFQRYNRSLDREAGKPASAGSRDFCRTIGEPCPGLLRKIALMKEERINQTAHLILAEALGVRLTPTDDARPDHVHGSYEKTPNRHTVDLVAIENLDRYLTSQGRAPSENSRLMKWSHRAVRDKIKMLIEDPFGIPVLEVAAGYSSQFCARTARPGARCREASRFPTRQRKLWDRWSHDKTAKNLTRAKLASYLLKQFDELEGLNEERRGKRPYSLFLPEPGGPLFKSLGGTQIQQADVNAAFNIGLRAICAPDELSILHKVRSEKKKDQFLAVRTNKREKAAFSAKTLIELDKAPSQKLSKASKPNFFYCDPDLADFDIGKVKTSSGYHPLVSGVAFHSQLREHHLREIIELNEKRLEEKFRDKINI